MENLGIAYCERTHGDRQENIDKSIHYLSKALKVVKYEDNPNDWALLHLYMGINNYSRTRNRAQNLEDATMHLYNALRVYSATNNTARWADTELFLGEVLLERLHGDHNENIEESIRHIGAALTEFTQELFPAEWSRAQCALGKAYLRREVGDLPDNIERAIVFITRALPVMMELSSMAAWGAAQVDLGYAYCGRVVASEEEELSKYEDGIAAFLRGASALPEGSSRWGTAQLGLGVAYAERVAGDPVHNMALSEAYLKRALPTFDLPSQAIERVTTLAKLGSISYMNPSGDRSTNIERAINYFQDALDILDGPAGKVLSPFERTTLLEGQALAYVNRLQGNVADNLELAEAALREALHIHEAAGLLMELSEAHASLGKIYQCEQKKGDRAKNLETAILHFVKALRLQSKSVAPLEWARIHLCLAEVYKDRIKGYQQGNALQAIFHCKKSLEVLSESLLPEDCNTARMLLCLMESRAVRLSQELD